MEALSEIDIEILLSFCEANQATIRKADAAAPTALVLSDLLHMAYYDADGRPQDVDRAVRVCTVPPSIWSGVRLDGVLLVRQRGAPATG